MATLLLWPASAYAGGTITGTSMVASASNGAGYVDGDTGTIDGGTADATYIIDWANNYPITAVNQGTNTITVSGNHSDRFPPGVILRVTGSTGNDGYYPVVSATFVIDHTDIAVSQAIPSSTADGALYDLGASMQGAVLAAHVNSGGTNYEAGVASTTATSGSGTGFYIIITAVTP